MNHVQGLTTLHFLQLKPMIKINELRKGSWVDTVGGPQQVDQIYGYSVLLTDGDERPTDQLFPIHLEPKVLVKFGFKRCSCGGWKGPIHLDKNFSYNNSKARAEYVHQLQNLYFALKGEELIINL